MELRPHRPSNLTVHRSKARAKNSRAVGFFLFFNEREVDELDFREGNRDRCVSHPHSPDRSLGGSTDRQAGGNRRVGDY